ncbi:MAG: hypothetical protein U5N85_11745 [Arcicella sp.]|nr:hypothetical protein [Arcicella sp.]
MPLPNEDRIWVDNPCVWAVADGAGGTGILCGEWAEFLLKYLPDAPIGTFEEFMAWLEPLTETFINTFEPQMQQDAFQLKRFYQEGSACTLAVIWQTEGAYHWLIFGDSHVFFYVDNLLESHPFQTAEALSGGTHLLNWSVFPNEKGFKTGTFSLQSEYCLLATDAISKHILQAYQSQLVDFQGFLKTLSEALTSEEHFWQYIKNHPDIEEDDYSLVLIRP